MTAFVKPLFTTEQLQAHRAVWDAATCAAIEAELARRKRYKAPRDPSIPFAGLLFCGHCGYAMSSATDRSRGEPFGRPYRQYSCQRPTRIRRGAQLDGDHEPNWISENKLIGLLQDQLDALTALDIEDAISLLAAYVPPAARGHDSQAAELAELEAQMAEMHPDLAAAKSSGARSAIDAELSRLAAQAELLRRSTDDAAPQVDYDRLRAGWGAVASGPKLRDLPDTQLRAVVNSVFSALYIAAGQIVPAPTQTR